VTRIATEIEIEEEEDLVGVVVLVVAAGVFHVVAVVVVGAVTGVAAEVVAGTGAETGHVVEVPETDEMIDQAS
jgi:hypothetical protein